MPVTKQQFCSFLGMAGFCCLWIPHFGLWLILYMRWLKPQNGDSWLDSGNEQTFQAITKLPWQWPRNSNRDFTKHFILYVAEGKGVAVGVLIEKLGLETWPDAYLYQTGQNSPMVAWMHMAKLLSTFLPRKPQGSLWISLWFRDLVLTPHR
jgi:hypothetical protein